MRRSAWRCQISDDGTYVSCGPREEDLPPPKPFGEWARSGNGDVTDFRAFNAHMAQVGEEDQSIPGWDEGA